MKKLNNKGMTAVEILVCFILVVVITVSMFTTLSTYKNKQQIESFKQQIYTYKNLLAKDINDDLIKIGLVDAKITENINNAYGVNYSVDLFFKDGTVKCLKVESKKAYDYLWDKSLESQFPAAKDQNDSFMISYGYKGNETKFPIPDLGESKNPNNKIIKDLRINDVSMDINDGVITIYIGFYHPDLGTRYSINIGCPINFGFNDNDNIPPAEVYGRLRFVPDEPSETSPFLDGPIARNKIESIAFVDTNVVPSDSVGSFDASDERNGSIMAWYYDIDANGLYEFYIGSNSGTVYANLNSRNLFKDMTSLTSLDVGTFNTIGVTDMRKMFNNCKKIDTLNLIKFNTASVKNMEYMFWHCENLKNVNVTSFDTSKVTNIHGIFADNYVIENINISSFRTGSAINMHSMFWDDRALKSIDVSKFDTSNATDIGNMFARCGSLSTIDVSNFRTSKVQSFIGMFADTNVTSLNINHFDTRNATDLFGIFQSMHNIKEIDISSWETPNLVSNKNMFVDCSSLQTIKMNKMTFDKVTSGNDGTVFGSVGTKASDPNNITIYVKDEKQQQLVNNLFNAGTGRTAKVLVG